MDIFAVVGPPHSGKSVLVRSLFRIGGFYIVSAQPDGEGMWKQYLEDLTLKTPKGSTEDERQWSNLAIHARNLRKNLRLLRDHAVLDMGGRVTPDKADFLRGAKAKVIALIRSDMLDEVLLQWEDLVSKANRPIVAYLISKKNAISKIIQNEPGKPFKAELSGLDRGNEENIIRDPVFIEFVDYLKRIADSTRPEPSDRQIQIIDVNALAYTLGVNIKEGHPNTRPWWGPWHVPGILKYIDSVELTGDLPQIISGPSPNFVVTALSIALYKKLSMYPQVEDPKLTDGVMQLHKLPVGTSKGPFKMDMMPYRVYINLNPEIRIFSEEDVYNWVLPDPQSKGVILGGRAPNWLYALTAVSYIDNVPWIGVMQPQLIDGYPGYVVVYSKDKNIKVGTAVRFNPEDV